MPPALFRDVPQDLGQALELGVAEMSQFLLLSQCDVRPAKEQHRNLLVPCKQYFIKPRGEDTDWWLVYDMRYPAPQVSTDAADEFGPAMFGVSACYKIMQQGICALTQEEVLCMVGFKDCDSEGVRHLVPEAVNERIPLLAGVQGARAWMTSLAEAIKEEPWEVKDTGAPVMAAILRHSWPKTDNGEAIPVHAVAFDINRWTTITLPTAALWEEALQEDANTKWIMDALDRKHQLEKGQLNHPGYWEPFEGCFQWKTGCCIGMKGPGHCGSGSSAQGWFPRS